MSFHSRDTETGQPIVRIGAAPDGDVDATVAAVMRYWAGLVRDGAVPARLALDPVAMQPVLPRCAILERPRAGAIRVRLAGRAINAAMGMEVRGMPIRALFAMPDRARLQARIDAAFTDPAILLIDAIARAPQRPALRAQMAFLPLTDTAGAVTRALFVLAAPPIPDDRLPCRWSVAGIARQPVGRGRPAPSADSAGHLLRAARRPPEGATPTARPKGPPQLRLVDGGRA